MLWDKEEKIALTFDDGPNPKNTLKILDILKEMNVKAAFFVIGKYVDEYPDIVKSIQKEGHLIGNHSYSHTDDFKMCGDVISKIIGRAPQFVRMPHLDINILKSCKHLLRGMIVVGASNISYDWMRISGDKIIKNVMRNAEDKSIVLLHDGDDNGDFSRSDTLVEALPIMIERLRTEGFKLVRVDDKDFMKDNPSMQMIK